jgi:hypothetical protein
MTSIPQARSPRFQRPNPCAAGYGRTAWQDYITPEGRRRLIEEGVLPPPAAPPAPLPNYASMSYEQKRALQDAARGGR